MLHAYQVDSKFAPRTRQLTAAQAIARLNTIVDDANARIATALSHAAHFEKVAEELYQENTNLRQAIAGLEAKVADLEAKSKKASKKKTRPTPTDYADE